MQMSYRILENVSAFKFYQNIHVHIAYCHCAKDQIENQTQKLLISLFKYILYDYIDSCLIFKTPITQNSKSTCFANIVETITQNLDMGIFHDVSR